MMKNSESLAKNSSTPTTRAEKNDNRACTAYHPSWVLQTRAKIALVWDSTSIHITHGVLAGNGFIPPAVLWAALCKSFTETGKT